MCFPQWVKTNGPYTGNVECLATLPNGTGGTNIIACISDYCGRFGQIIYLSTNNGTSWDRVDIRPTATSVSAFIISGENLFAGGSGVYLSTDHGISWSLAGLSNTNIYAFAVSGENLFAGTPDGVFLSTDNGKNWNPVKTGLPEHYIVRALAAFPNDTDDISIIVSGYNYFDLNNINSVYFSTDKGISWYPVDSGLTNTSVLTFAVSKNDSNTNLFAGTDSDGVFLSIDNGKSWNPAGLSHCVIKSFTISGENLFAGSDGDGIFLSTNNGSSWNPLNTGLTNTNVRSLAVSHNGSSSENIVAGTSGGIFLSTDYGIKWNPINTGLLNSHVHTFASIGNELFAGTADGVFLTTDYGTSWAAVNNGLTNASVSAFAISHNGNGGSDLFVGTYHSIFLSTDKGESWNPVNNSSFEDYGVLTLAISTNNVGGTNLFAGGSQGVCLSTDKGISWNSVNNGLTSSAYVNALVISDTNIFAGTGDGIFLSTNNGTNWNTLLPNIPTDALVVANDEVGGTNLFAGTSNGVFLSTDNGVSWDTVRMYPLATCPKEGGGTNLFAGTSNGVFLSTNNGINWNPVNSEPDITSLIVSGEFLFAASFDDYCVHSGGVWRRPLSEMITSVDEYTNQLPEDFNLCQNYPNPFNPTTKIEYSISKKSHITLKVFDILGTEIKTLVNEEKSAGNYQVEFNAANLPSGVYFYRIQAGSFNQVRKTLLIK